MQSVNTEIEIGNFLSELVADVRLESDSFVATVLNLGCSFHIGRNVPHINLIKTAFLISDRADSDINVYISTDTDLFALKGSSFREIMENLHPASNRFGNYRFSADPSGNFLYFYDTDKKIGGVWISPNVSVAPEMLITPFRAMISWILESADAVILHASSFTVEGKNILLAGPSGSGKSTIAFEALIRSETVICDDAVALTRNSCFPIYSKMKLKSSLGSIKSSGAEIKCEQVGSKSVLNLRQVLNFQRNGYLPDFLLFPSLALKSRFDDLSKNEALKKIMTDSFSETLGSSIGALRLMNLVFSNVRTMTWHLDPNPSLNWEELKILVSKHD